MRMEDNLLVNKNDVNNMETLKTYSDNILKAIQVDKLKDEYAVNPQLAFLGPSIWENSCDDINFSSVLDNLFFFDETSDNSNVDLTASTPAKVDDTPTVATPPDKNKVAPVKNKRGRKPGPHSKAKMAKQSKEVLVPGADYDPKTALDHDVLKPQPIIRKSEKKDIPRESKDLKYWKRRIKNNEAARKSREARRAKDNQIVLRAAYLEEECEALRAELNVLKAENETLKKQLKKIA